MRKNAASDGPTERSANAPKDLTEARLGEVLARHQRLAALGEMAATLAHQIRTPLSAALLYTTNAAALTLPEARRQELLGRAVDCLHDLEFLVGDLLRFARGAAASGDSANLPDVLAAVERAALPLLRPGQSLVVQGQLADARLKGTREALTGALLNLVSNALQAAGPAARVDLAARVGGGFAELTVTDNGPGIPVDLRRRIFDPFFTTRGDGTGLGLAVVRSLAESAGGTVRVEDSPGGGARFVLTLPLAAATPTTPLKSHPAAGDSAAA